jgi:hypothetical protein
MPTNARPFAAIGVSCRPPDRENLGPRWTPAETGISWLLDVRIYLQGFSVDTESSEDEEEIWEFSGSS